MEVYGKYGHHASQIQNLRVIFFGTCKAPSVQRQDFECTTLAATHSKSCSTYNSRYPRECVERAATPFGPM